MPAAFLKGYKTYRDYQGACTSLVNQWLSRLVGAWTARWLTEEESAVTLGEEIIIYFDLNTGKTSLLYALSSLFVATECSLYHEIALINIEYKVMATILAKRLVNVVWMWFIHIKMVSRCAIVPFTVYFLIAPLWPRPTNWWIFCFGCYWSWKVVWICSPDLHDLSLLSNECWPNVPKQHPNFLLGPVATGQG